jgi:hypothetical protein
MKAQIQKLQEKIEPLRQQIINHKVYNSLETVEDLKVFMRYHVYAVWDFMSLLKSLQSNLTCTTTPWFPVGNADTRFLINEIVVGEESDVDMNGVRKSHFEIYLDAMQQCGVDLTEIETFVNHLKTNKNLQTAFENAKTPAEAQDFVNATFNLIATDKDYLQSAVFTFGREDLIPNMFISLVNDISKKFPNSVSIFKYYLERHIEVDGDHHSHLALAMTANLCGDNQNYWDQAEEAVISSLESRIKLWDGVYEEILESKGEVVY